VQSLQRIVWSEAQVTNQLGLLLGRAFDNVIKRVEADKISNRLAANAIGVERVPAGKRLRGLFP
jgi:glutamate dehydrogenase (NAD(P)+)